MTSNLNGRMTRDLACAIAESNSNDPDLTARLYGLSDGVVVLLRGRDDIAFRVLSECQEESEAAAIGWSKDRQTWCVVCDEPTAFSAAACRLAEEFHLFDGLDSPVAKSAGIRVLDRRDEETATIASLCGDADR